ncbi:hypothetical protein VNI00_001567 [Paramarasmius palmivorus]|uniref:YDG domain-containing protein n=1 Tax=Paramarasmius palmivorus TaxID=297713 RepID=A0AAW0E142_9AGAR
MLKALGLDKPFIEPKQQRQPKASKKRKAPVEEEDSDSTPPPPKASRTVASSDTGGLRRSTRNSGKVVDYKSEKIIDDPEPVSVKAGIKKKGNTGPQGGLNGRRVHDPPFVAGISGGTEGAYSVALSGGYEDDVDEGYAFTYTGSGGRDLKGTKTAPKNLRTAPQSFDQSFDDHRNRALKVIEGITSKYQPALIFRKVSSETKKPVRVIRGYKLDSRYAPYEGYRYDGLYVVEKVWMEKGLNSKGYKVCKFAFKRLPNQPPLPVKDDGDDENEDSEAEGESRAESEVEPAETKEEVDD